MLYTLIFATEIELLNNETELCKVTFTHVGLILSQRRLRRYQV
jgi:hypothetical protein